MKRTIATIATAVLMTLSFSSFANSGNNPLNSKPAKAILSTYVEAITIGNTDLNDFLFTEDFQYENTTNERKYGKKEYVLFLKQNKGITYDCNSNFEILDQTENTAIAKTTMKFKNFTRVDYITLVNSNGSWQVSKVITTY